MTLGSGQFEIMLRLDRIFSQMWAGASNQGTGEEVERRSEVLPSGLLKEMHPLILVSVGSQRPNPECEDCLYRRRRAGKIREAILLDLHQPAGGSSIRVPDRERGLKPQEHPVLHCICSDLLPTMLQEIPRRRESRSTEMHLGQGEERSGRTRSRLSRRRDDSPRRLQIVI